MKPNIGIVNAMLRITCGLSMLTFLKMRAEKNQGHSLHPFMVVAASMKVAEGIVRYCPLTAAYQEMKKSEEEQF